MVAKEVVKRCPHCGKELMDEFIFCEEWCQYLFCSWGCVLEFSK